MCFFASEFRKLIEMAKKIQQTFTNGHNEEHYKIIVVGGGLVNNILSFKLFESFPLNII